MFNLKKIVLKVSTLHNVIFRKLILTLLFGKNSLDGYYVSKTVDSKYVLSSVFPNRDIMDESLKTSIS